MDFQSAMETFAEAWVAANTKGGTLPDVGCSQNQAMALTSRGCKTPPSPAPPASQVPPPPPPSRSPPTPRTPPQQEPTSLMQPIPGPPKDAYDVTKPAPAKSLPVHCVVEAVSALEDTTSRQHWGVRHHHRHHSSKPVIETDSYVIIPVNTAFQELVQVALHRLGYPRDSASAAKGSVVIKNWKPLSFDKIAESPLVTVGDILGELTTVATLRIQLYRARPTVLSDIKDKLLRLLLLQSHGLLVSSGCPLDELTLSHLCRSPSGSVNTPEPSEECRRRFEQWWSLQLSSHQQQTQQHHPQVSPHRPHSASQYSPTGGGAAGAGHHPPPTSKLLDRAPSLQENVHPALQTVQSQYPTQKTRMRTSFDPELELPKLQRWFAENQHPSRQQIQQYVKELNGLESRRGRKPLDINNVVYWFKNARAAQKRAELRSVGPGGLQCHLSLNGYNSASHSPSHHVLNDPRVMGGPMKSPPVFLHSDDNSNNGNSDQEDDLEELSHQHHQAQQQPQPLGVRGDPREEIMRAASEGAADGGPPNSPVRPLSLTTSDKDNRSRSHSPAPPPPAATPNTAASSPKSNSNNNNNNLPEQVESIKQEPPDDDSSPVSPGSHHASKMKENNNNNNNQEDISDVEDEEDDEEPDDLARRKDDDEEDEEEIGTMHPARIGELSRQQQQQRFRSPSPNDLIVARHPPPGGPPGAGRGPANLGFPLVPNSMFSHSIMYMSHYIPGLHHHALGPAPPSSSAGSGGPGGGSPVGSTGLNLSALAAADERRKRNRTFIDPVTEVPRLEQWFSLNTHPSHNLILKYTEELNRMPYRQKFPRLEPKNVQFWFKNRRAKCKRLKMSLFETTPPPAPPPHHQLPPYHHASPPDDSIVQHPTLSYPCATPRTFLSTTVLQ